MKDTVTIDGREVPQHKVGRTLGKAKLKDGRDVLVSGDGQDVYQKDAKKARHKMFANLMEVARQKGWQVPVPGDRRLARSIWTAYWLKMIKGEEVPCP